MGELAVGSDEDFADLIASNTTRDPSRIIFADGATATQNNSSASGSGGSTDAANNTALYVVIAVCVVVVAAVVVAVVLTKKKKGEPKKEEESGGEEKISRTEGWRTGSAERRSEGGQTDLLLKKNAERG